MSGQTQKRCPQTIARLVRPALRSDYLVSWLLVSIAGLYYDFLVHVWRRQSWFQILWCHALLAEVLASFLAALLLKPKQEERRLGEGHAAFFFFYTVVVPPFIFSSPFETYISNRHTWMPSMSNAQGLNMLKTRFATRVVF